VLIQLIEGVIDVLDQEVAIIFKEGPQFVWKRIDGAIDDQALCIVSPCECSGGKA
jgi:hypothetical protein